MGSRKYLSPEPLLQDPGWVGRELKAGNQVPVYGYALNNPILYADPDGRWAGVLRFLVKRLLPELFAGAAGHRVGACDALPPCRAVVPLLNRAMNPAIMA